jgi:hypothetical protein
MKTPLFQRFNQPEVVGKLEIRLIHDFLQRFEKDLQASQIPLPRLEPSRTEYYKAAAALLGNQGALPEAMVEAILAIEEMAAPEQTQRREAAFWQSPSDLCIDGKSSPENVALHLWLWSPYQRTLTAACPLPASTPAVQQPSSLPPDTISPPSPTALPQPTRTPPACVSPLPPPESLPDSSSGAAALSATPKAGTSNDTGHRRTGKVAQLRKAARDKISEMICDGFTYAEIIQELGPDGVGLSQVNISNWKIEGGHTDWLRAKEKREALEAREEVTMDLARDHTGATIQQASRQIASTHICELLMDLDHAALNKAIATNPMAFTRLLNALSRLTADELACARFRAEEAQREAQLQKNKVAHIPPEDRGLTPENLHKIEQVLHLR